MSTGRADSERLAAALRAAGIDARPRPDCPPADRLWKALHLQLPADERAELIDHTIECPSCAEAWRLAMEMDREDATLVSASPIPVPWLQRPAAWAGLVAAGLVVVVGALMLQQSGPAGVPGLRDRPAEAIRSLLPEDAALPREGFSLRWSSGPEGTRYDVVVTTAGLEVVADVQGLERPDFTVPPDRLASLASGTRLLWRIVAHAPDGTTLSSSTNAVIVR